MKWLAGLTGRSRQPGERHGSGLLDHAAFERELTRQRALSDRAGGRFALLVFDSLNGSDGGKGPIPAQLLERAVVSRVRLSDLAGVCDEAGGKIGVILSDTDCAGAACFLRSLEDLLRSGMNGTWRPESRLTCSISRYPDYAERIDMAAREAPGPQARAAASVREVPAGNAGRI